MSRHIFLYPIFDRKTLTAEERNHQEIASWSSTRPKEILYVTYNFSTVEDVVICNVKPELYLFCRVPFTQTFQNIIKFSTMTNNNIIADVSLIIRVTDAEYNVVTNAGFMSFASQHRIDDQLMPSVLYIFQADTYDKLSSIYKKLQNIKTIMPIFNIIMPQTLEMSFFLKKIFQIGKTGSIVDDKKIMTASAENKSITSTAVTHLYNPTDTFNCFVDSDTKRVGAFSCHPDANVTKKFLNTIPRVNIAVIFKYPNIDFHPSNEIVAIIISLYTCELHSMLVILNLCKSIKACPSLNGYHKELSMYIYTCDNESDLLKRFVKLYAAGELFENLQLATRQLHWLMYTRNSGSMEAIYSIMDRIFYIDKTTKVLVLCKVHNGTILLNGNAMLYDTGSSSSSLPPTYSTSTPIVYDYIKDVFNVPTIVLSIESDSVVVNNNVITDFRADVAHLYRNLLGRDVHLQTPIMLIKKYIHHFTKLYEMFNIEYLYEASNALKIAISNLDFVSPSEKSRLYLFFHYMKQGVILLPTNNVTASRSIIDNKTLDVYDIKRGGHVYSRPGMFSDFVACIDFSSFYPSIYSAFSLSFDNVAVISGRDLIKIFTTKSVLFEYISSFGIIFKMDETYANVDQYDFVEDIWYIVIIKSQCVYSASLGGLCSEFIDKRKSSTVQKNIINTLCGCIGSDNFTLQSNDLYNVNTFLGRRIILFACSELVVNSGDDDDDEEELALEFFKYDATRYRQSENIINIDTDGFCVITRDYDSAVLLCKRICNIYEIIIKIFEQKIKINRVKSHRNIIQCKISFHTNFIINCEKKRYFYVGGGDEVVVRGTNVTDNIAEIVTCMYKRKKLDIFNYKSADTKFLFNAYYVAMRKNIPDMTLEKIREIVERNGGFTFDAATNLFGHCERDTDFSFLYNKKCMVTNFKNILLRDLLQKYFDK